VELRQLRAFEAVATDLHFGRAAKRLFTSQPAVSEQIRRLERELGTALFRRTSRRVALTPAGVELLSRSRVILAQVNEAAAAVRRLADAPPAVVRLGVTPPVVPVLAPHLIASLAEVAPDIGVDLRQMWLPDLHSALVDGSIDVGVTPGATAPPAGVRSQQFGCEPLLAGVRPTHRLAGRSNVTPGELSGDVLGLPSEALFPAWVNAQSAVLAEVGIEPPTAPLMAADISALRWVDQPEVDWILLTPSLSRAHHHTVFISFEPPRHVAFTLLWPDGPAPDPSVERFVTTCLSTELPTGWVRPA
jgi:DNA-binding transcriptional LysR family regulator